MDIPTFGYRLMDWSKPSTQRTASSQSNPITFAGQAEGFWKTGNGPEVQSKKSTFKSSVFAIPDDED